MDKIKPFPIIDAKQSVEPWLERDQTSPIAPVAPSRSKSALSRPVERTFLSLSNYHASGLANSEADLYNIAGGVFMIKI